MPRSFTCGFQDKPVVWNSLMYAMVLFRVSFQVFTQSTWVWSLKMTRKEIIFWGVSFCSINLYLSFTSLAPISSCPPPLHWVNKTLSNSHRHYFISNTCTYHKWFTWHYLALLKWWSFVINSNILQYKKGVLINVSISSNSSLGIWLDI